MTKKEKEAKEAQDKKQKAFRERLKRMKELEKEILEMQQLVKDTVKNPAIKRRASYDFYFEINANNKKPEGELESCFNESQDFFEKNNKNEENRQSRLEWRAQFKQIGVIVEALRSSRWEEKQKRRDKSSDSHFIHTDLIKTINLRANEDEIRVLTELSFWEKIGFTNSSKRQMMLVKGK